MRFKGYEDFIVQDQIVKAHVIRFRRERWVTLEGKCVVAPLPAGIAGHFGAELKRPPNRHAIKSRSSLGPMMKHGSAAPGYNPM